MYKFVKKQAKNINVKLKKVIKEKRKNQLKELVKNGIV